MATIPSNVSDYNALKGFTGYDEEAILKSNLKVEGDVSLALFHARQTIGSFLSSNKFEGLLIAKLYFHTGFLSTNTSCIKVRLKDLDAVGIDANGVRDQRFPPNFKVVINFKPEKEIKKIEIVKSPSKSLGLIFTSQAEHESNHSMMQFSSSSQGSTPTGSKRGDSPLGDDSGPPKVPPRLKTKSSFEKSSRSPTPTSMKSTSQESSLRLEDLISPVVDLPPEIITPANTAINNPSKRNTELLIDTNPTPPPKEGMQLKPQLGKNRLMERKEIGDMVRPASDTLLLDLGIDSTSKQGNEPSAIHHSQQNLDKKRTNPSNAAAVDNLLDISGGASTMQSSSSKFNKMGPELDLFGTDFVGPLNSFGDTIKASNSAADLFMMTESTSQPPSGSVNSNNNLLGDFGDFAAPTVPVPNSTSNSAQMKAPLLNPSIKPASTADQLVDNLLI